MLSCGMCMRVRPSQGGTSRTAKRCLRMKQIALISVSTFVLGAASIAAAEFDRLSPDHDGVVVSASVNFESRHAGMTPDTVPFAKHVRDHTAEVRRILKPAIAVDSCEDAYWPHIPEKCLEQAAL